MLGLDGKGDVAKAKTSFVTGIMKLGVVRAKNLVGDEKGKDGKLTSDPMVVVKFKNHEKTIKITTDDVEQNLNPIWNEHQMFNVKILNDGAPPPFEVEVYDHDFVSNDLIGQTKIKSNPCFDAPCEWAINSFFPLMTKEKKSGGGDLYLRAYFVPDGQFDPNKNPIDAETKEEFILKFNKVKLHFRMIAGRELVYLKDGIPQPTISPYAQLLFPNGKTKETKAVTNSANPNWMYNYTGTVELSDKDSLQPIQVTIYHKTGMLSKDIPVSKLQIDLKECLDSRGKWIINRTFTIPGEEKFLRPNNLKDMGKVYVQAKVVESSRIDDEIEPEMLIEMPTVKPGEIRGTVLIYVVHCKDLPVVDSGLGGNSCDAFVKFTTKGGDSVETPVAWGDLNPIFEKRLLMSYKVSSAAEAEDMQVSVFDQDRMSGSDLIGKAKVDMLGCLSKPNEWAVNQAFKIEDIDKKYKRKDQTPEVYFMMKFIPEGQVDEGELPPLKEDLKRTLGDRKRSGSLVIRVIHARGLIKSDTGLAGSSSDPYAELTLPPKGKTYKTEAQKNTLTPFWNKEFVHPIEVSDVRYVDPAVIKVWDYDGIVTGGGDDLIGFVEVDVRPALNDRNVWVVNDALELKGPEKLKEKLKLKNFGFIYVQMLYLNKGETMAPAPVPKENIEEMKKAAEVKGTIVVRVVHAKDLMRGDKPVFGDGLGTSDPFVRIKWPNEKTSDTDRRNSTLTPVWNQTLQQSVSLNKLNIPMLFLEVLDWDPMSNDLLGSCYVDIDECVLNPGQWKVNGNHKLDGSAEFQDKFKYFGEVYIQVTFLLGSAKPDGTFPPVTENLKEVLEKNVNKGKLDLMLVHAEKVKAEDNNGKSDPYVIFTMPDKKEIRSRVVENCLNPIWEQRFSYPIEFLSAQIEPILVKVLDRDVGNPDDPLGKVLVDISQCVKAPGKWCVDQEFRLEPLKVEETQDHEAGDQTKPDLGKIYLQVRFLPEGLTDNTAPPPPKRNLKQELEILRIRGTVALVLVHGKALQVDNPKSCKVFASVGFKGDKFSDTNYGVSRNPFFDHTFKLPLDLESADFLKPLTIQLYEKGTVFKSLVGELSVSLKEVVDKANANKWSLNKILPVTGPEELHKKFEGKLGEVYVQAKLLPPGEKNLGDRPPLLEDIKQIAAQEKIKGKLIVYVAMVMDVIPEDGKTCDPLVQVTFNNTSQATDKKEKQLSAEFNQKLVFEVDFESVELVPALNVDVKDWDRVRNDDIGHLVLDVKDCFKNPSSLSSPRRLPLQRNQETRRPSESPRPVQELRIDLPADQVPERRRDRRGELRADEDHDERTHGEEPHQRHAGLPSGPREVPRASERAARPLPALPAAEQRKETDEREEADFFPRVERASRSSDRHEQERRRLRRRGGHRQQHLLEHHDRPLRRRRRRLLLQTERMGSQQSLRGLAANRQE